MPFTFSRLNDDVPDRAVFKLNNTCEYTTDDYLLHAICYQMGAKYNTAVDNLERIPAVCTDVRNYEEGKSLFVMQMRGGLCDGLTGFSVNEKAREISAPWKGLLSSFFGQKTAAANLSNAVSLCQFQFYPSFRRSRSKKKVGTDRSSNRKGSLGPRKFPGPCTRSTPAVLTWYCSISGGVETR